MQFLLYSLLFFLINVGGRGVPGGSQTEGEKNKYIVELEKQIAGNENQAAEEVFKNIELLKGQPAIRLLRIMEFGFSPALGVECSHCHVEGKWESDEKKTKVIARQMWGMVGEINVRVREIAGEKAVANCYTCHRGQVKPALSPASKE